MDKANKAKGLRKRCKALMETATGRHLCELKHLLAWIGQGYSRDEWIVYHRLTHLEKKEREGKDEKDV